MGERARGRFSVLVVDDDRAVQRSLHNLLAAVNVDVHAAATGIEAIKLLDRQPLDAVLVNLMMPRLDGIGVARALLARPLLQRPRLVFVVAGDPDVRRRLGVTRVFPVPVDTVEVARELDRALRGGP